MDWIKQRSFQNWVIGLLVALNFLMLGVVWMQSRREVPPAPREPRSGGGVSEALLREELDLTAEQAERFRQRRAVQMGGMRALNDELDSLKLRLADLVFKPGGGSGEAEALAERIGGVQSKLELARFHHFRDLAEICDEEQLGKLRPLLREVMGKRGPARQGEPAAERVEGTSPAPRAGAGGASTTRPPGRDEGRPAPPSLEEKVSRYVQRLSLSSAQAAAVAEILKDTRAREETFKSDRSPDREAFEREKQRLRKEEEKRILDLLDAAQKAEFERMMRNRQNPPPRD